MPAGRHFQCHLLCHPALRPRPPRSSELRENGRQGPHLPPSDLKNGLKPITEMSRSRGHSNSKLGHSMAEMNAAICEMRSSEFPRFRRRGTRAHVVRGRIDRPIQSEARWLPRAGELPFRGELVLGRKVSSAERGSEGAAAFTKFHSYIFEPRRRRRRHRRGQRRHIRNAGSLSRPRSTGARGRGRAGRERASKRGGRTADTNGVVHVSSILLTTIMW